MHVNHHGRPSVWARWMGAAVLVAAVFPPGAYAEKLDLQILQPGPPLAVVEILPVQIVFVGYRPGDGAAEIDVGRFAQRLPGFSISGGYWTGQDYDGDGLVQLAFMGWASLIDAQVRFADPSFEDDFFAYLAAIAQPAALTTQQQLYNEQAIRSRTIEQNVTIDAMRVERWLAFNGSRLGVDTTRPTVFFVNWFGRDDFRHHVYTLDRRDPDTGADARDRDGFAVTAWGGTAYNEPNHGTGIPFRVWFHDLSAGPEAWTDNWDITRPEVPDALAAHGAPDGQQDYRLPPIWEYGNTQGYRPFDSVSLDLALVTRFVAINMLFLGPALYDPWLSRTPKPPYDIQVDLQQIQFPGGADATQLAPAIFVDSLNAARRFDHVTVEQNPMAATEPIMDLYECWAAGWESGDSCYGASTGGNFFSDLVTYFDRHRLRYLEGDADTEILAVSLGIRDDQLEDLIGVADSVFTDTPYSAAPMSWTSPRVVAGGRGNTATLIHEIGHHMGFTHPHDGLDLEARILYSAFNAFHFAWAGDETNSVMSYLGGGVFFSQFDLDMFDRWLMVRYVNESKLVLAEILSRPHSVAYYDALRGADAYAQQALGLAFAEQYEGAHYFARRAHEQVLAVAAALHVPIDVEEDWPADYRGSFDNAPLLRSSGHATQDVLLRMERGASTQLSEHLGSDLRLLVEPR